MKNNQEHLEELATVILEINKEIQTLETQRNLISNKIKILKEKKESALEEHSKIRLKLKKDQPQEPLYKSRNYPWSAKVEEILRTKFKFGEFRPNQLTAINAILSNRDVILIMPTGGGKSLVYQLPTLVTGNITVVISPLISLIDDQLRALREIGISAATINSAVPKDEKRTITTNMMSGKLHVIFVTPEWIVKTKLFMNNLVKLYKEKKIARFVIDEIHCCSQWGHDFRTDYMSLSILKGQFPDVPILGLTATATTNVILDIEKILDIQDSVVITAPYNRPNLFYKVVTKPEEKSECVNYLEKLVKQKYKNTSGIIYVGSQKDCEDLANELRARDLKVAPYHAGLEPQIRSKVYRKWFENSYQAVVATIAFGMGIDKPDVRFVIHYTVPKSTEALYQETGRAGRDGKKADCILMFSLTDWLKHYAMTQNKTDESNSINILKYCLSKNVCRRYMISKYFDDEWRASDCENMCDFCHSLPITMKVYNIIQCAKDILSLIDTSTTKETNLTLKKLVDLWYQSGSRNARICKPQFTRDQAIRIIGFLLSQGIIIVRRGYNLVTTLAYLDTNLTLPFDASTFDNKIEMEDPQEFKGIPVLSSKEIEPRSSSTSRSKPQSRTVSSSSPTTKCDKSEKKRSISCVSPNDPGSLSKKK